MSRWYTPQYNVTVKLKKDRRKSSSAASPATAQPAAPALASASASTEKELAVGDIVDSDNEISSIEVTTDGGESATLKALQAQSKGGIVIFTYPKASTPGCM